ncbi:putative ABC transporter permease [Candidatus Saccharibacteria bacterium]|nr:putative ABC transporter permease [Candidatus Saccharibacteria bacterium]
MVKKVRAEWKKPEFWRNLFLYFWVFSLVGHIGEIGWANIGNWVGFRQTPASTIPLFAIAVPYGLGAIALRLLLYPSVKKKKINLVTIFVLGALITTAIEFVCAALVVLFAGHPLFWDYSDRPLNLWGFVCLGNSLAFGVGSVVALKWIFPYAEKWLERLRARYLNIAFWILFIGYILSQIWIRIIKS